MMAEDDKEERLKQSSNDLKHLKDVLDDLGWEALPQADASFLKALIENDRQQIEPPDDQEY